MSLTKQSLFIAVLCLFWISSAGQNVTINGDAPEFKGQEILAFGYTDHISDRLEWLGRTKIDTSGHFELELACEQIRYVGLRTSHVTAYMYIQPKATYKIEFPAPEPGVSITFNDKAKTDILFRDLELKDINSLIIDFNERYEGFFAQNYQLLQRLFSPSNKANETDSTEAPILNRTKGGMVQLMERMEAFIGLMDTVYMDFDNHYFKTYRTAALGDLLLNGRVDDRKAFFERFIQPVAFNAQHKAQTELEQRFFKDYFLNYVRSRGDEALGIALNEKGSYQELSQVLSKDDFLAAADRRERIIASAISEVWTNKSMVKERMASILDSLGQRPPDPRLQKLGKDVLYVLSSMDDGFSAYDFQLNDQFNDALTLSRFKGKPIILEFWASWCTSCEKESAIFKNLAETYSGRVQFISINMDDSYSESNASDGPILEAYGLDDPMLKEIYQVMTLPQYTIIDKDGLIYDAYTMTPSEGLEIYLMALTKNETKPSRPGIGSKEN
jgi:thiol-disulfide isomerase/thioredoxin